MRVVTTVAAGAPVREPLCDSAARDVGRGRNRASRCSGATDVPDRRAYERVNVCKYVCRGRPLRSSILREFLDLI